MRSTTNPSDRDSTVVCLSFAQVINPIRLQLRGIRYLSSPVHRLRSSRLRHAKPGIISDGTEWWLRSGCAVDGRGGGFGVLDASRVFNDRSRILPSQERNQHSDEESDGCLTRLARLLGSWLRIDVWHQLRLAGHGWILSVGLPASY